MSDYIAPTKEILFVIQELANLDYISSFSGFEDATEDLVEAIIEEAGKFSAEVIADTNVTGDKIGSTVVDKQVIETKGFKEAYQQIAEGGWISLACEQEFGGQGLPATIACGVNETLMSANLGLSLVIILSQSAISALSAHGSESLKKVYLENLVSGRWTGTMNLTEPQAGSDLSTVKTIATPHEDYYLIRGTKIFITWGDHGMTDNIVHLVLARTPDAPNGTSGLSLFLVPKFLVNDDGSLGERNDVFPISVEHKLGIHGSPTCILGFGENEGAQGFLIGELGKGLNAMFTMMNHARLDVALQGVAVSERDGRAHV